MGGAELKIRYILFMKALLYLIGSFYVSLRRHSTLYTSL